MLDKNKLVQSLADCIVAVFEQGMDEDEHFRTSLATLFSKEQLEQINEDDINHAMQFARSELKDLIFVMIDEIISEQK